MWHNKVFDVTETSTVMHGDENGVRTNGVTALLRRRLQIRTYQFHMALHHCGEQVAFLVNGCRMWLYQATRNRNQMAYPHARRIRY